MPKDYAPRKVARKARRNTGRGKQQANTARFSGASFGGGLFCGAALMLGLIYGPTLWPALSSTGTAESSSAAVPRPELKYEFMNRLPTEEVVTNVTPYRAPPEATVEQASDTRLAVTKTATAAAKTETAAAETATAAAETATAAAKTATVVPDKSDRAPLHLLQAASFRDKDEANALRATLLLEGMNVSVSEAARADGAWHRVMVGPFATERDLESALTQLRARDIPAMRVAMPPG